MATEITCYGQTVMGTMVDEYYETAAKTAGRRARMLRKLGYKVLVRGMGPQTTHYGRVCLTQLTILEGDMSSIPYVKIVKL